uniref:Lysozyme n=1 Tax=Homalodisca liturata TaxID=320908 RepID=A0A1B6JTA6_9HEMI
MVPDGIDVTCLNETVDWSKVKAAGIKFAIARATQGANFVDNKFVENFNGMKSNGIKAGAYHYLEADQSVDRQVARIQVTLKKVDFDATNDVLAIVLEERFGPPIPPDVIADNLQGVLTALEKAYKKLYIYCNPNYWEEKVSWKKYDFSQYNLWITSLTNFAASPTIPTTWKDKGHVWWQYSMSGTVDGVVGFVHVNKSK